MKNQMTLGSLFDGIAGFPLAAERHGIKTVWASEIEPNCIEIAERHFPNIVQLGDLTRINGGEIEPVDIISFGSPCQDLSIAGKQVGLDGDRSGLFLEAVRIIREMRLKTNGEYPKYAVWENVTGALSSNEGEDFRRVLEEITNSAIPMPTSRKWATAGMVRVTGGGSTAWRVFDAQYWGVAQRRKRIYLVADFREDNAPEILFKCESLLGYLEESGSEEKGTAGNAEIGIIEDNKGQYVIFEPRSQDGIHRICNNVFPTLNTAQGGQRQPCICMTIPIHDKATRANGNCGNGLYVGNPGDPQYTLTTADIHGVAYIDGEEVVVRRMTPIEGERLQGFPDDWTKYGKDGKEISDTQRYKAIGNSIAVPCAERVFAGILAVEQEEETWKRS